MYNEGSVPREGDIVIVSGFIKREKSFNQNCLTNGALTDKINILNCVLIFYSEARHQL